MVLPGAPRGRGPPRWPPPQPREPVAGVAPPRGARPPPPRRPPPRRRPHCLNRTRRRARLVVVVGPVRKVEPRDAHPRAQQLLDDFDRPRLGAQGADDLWGEGVGGNAGVGGGRSRAAARRHRSPPLLSPTLVLERAAPPPEGAASAARTASMPETMGRGVGGAGGAGRVARALAAPPRHGRQRPAGGAGRRRF